MKAIAIIAVVAGHTMFDPVHDFVYIYHLPVFYFVAGYFFKEVYADNKMEYVIKRMQRLLFPLICYGLVFLLAHNWLFSLNIYSDTYGYQTATSHLFGKSDYISAIKRLLLCDADGCGNLLGALWFVRSLMFSTIAFCFLLWLSKKISIIYKTQILCVYIFVIVLLLNALDSYLIPLSYNIVRDMLTLPYILIGYLFAGKENKIPTNISIFVILTFFLSIISVFYKTEISVHYDYLFTNYILCGLGILWTYQLAGLLQFSRFRSCLCFIGKYTFEIMALHFLAFKLISILQIYIYGYDIKYLSKFPVIENNTWLWWIPYTIVGVAFPLGFAWVKEEIKKLIKR